MFNKIKQIPAGRVARDQNTVGSFEDCFISSSTSQGTQPSSGPHPFLLLPPWWMMVTGGLRSSRTRSALHLRAAGHALGSTFCLEPFASRTTRFSWLPAVSLDLFVRLSWWPLTFYPYMMESSRAWLSHLSLPIFLPLVSTLFSCRWSQVYLSGPDSLLECCHQHLPECHAIWICRCKTRPPIFTPQSCFPFRVLRLGKGTPLFFLLVRPNAFDPLTSVSHLI